jgi:hypothetical protein
MEYLKGKQLFSTLKIENESEKAGKHLAIAMKQAECASKNTTTFN